MAETRVTANPPNNGGINVNELSSKIIMFVTCAIIGYNEINTIILRIIVLISLYPIIAQFTNIMIFDESSFTLIPPLLGGLAVTLVSAAILFKKYRKQKDQEMVSG